MDGPWKGYSMPSPMSTSSHIQKSTATSQWSLGILTGPSIDRLQTPSGIINPVLTTRDIHDRQSSFIADPFLFRDGKTWYLFFEMFDVALNRGVIAYAQSSDGLRWSYQQVVLEEPFHLSYPYVFSHGGEIYMVPETKKAREVRVYRATDFPKRWEFCRTLIRGRFADASIVFWQERWWMFVARGAYSMAIFHSDQLLEGWRSHWRQLFYIRNKSCARPGGRVIVDNGQLIRFAQDAKVRYGHQLRAFAVDKLSKLAFKEHEMLDRPLLTPSQSGWNCVGMHHIDPQRTDDGNWLAVVDGAGYPFETEMEQTA